ncbi:MAG: TIGR04141 family sporadically distributed protein, partial [Lachnospiraceae bacterium]|nr:TIGR04141 family sporadically distributed protein [Lachnospiraceae bacterium]
MPNRNKLSIFMIKEEFIANEDIIEKYNNTVSVDGVGTVYWGDSHVNTPQWANSFFAGSIDTDRIFTANARAVLLVRIPIDQDGAERIFAVTMGYGKNMLKDNVTEERFGLKVILNTIKSDSL